MGNFISRVCPICGKTTDIKVDARGFNAYVVKHKPVQVAFPKLNDFEREAIISGYCFNCQSSVFHRPVPGDESWGEIIGECLECGTPIYSEKDKVADETYICHSCKEEYEYENGQLHYITVS